MGNAPDVETLLERVDEMGFLGLEEFRQKFDHLPDDVGDSLIRRLPRVGPHAGILIAEWVENRERHDALLPLMRYVFDTRHSTKSSNARAKAMDAIISLARKEDMGRVHAFALDMAEDSDPFVRGRSMTLLGKAGGKRAAKAVKEGTRDNHAFVRQTAQKVLHRNPRIESMPDPELMRLDDSELLQLARRSNRRELEQLFEHLRIRDNGLQVLEKLIVEDNARSTLVLRELSNFETSKARDLLGRVLSQELYGRKFQMALSALIPFLDSTGLTEVEADAVGRALECDDRPLICTACRIVRIAEEGAFGRTISRLLFHDDEEVLAAAALAMDGIADGTCSSLFSAVEEGFRNIHALRVDNPTTALIEAETAVLRVLRTLYRTGEVDTPLDEIMNDLFLSMHAALDKPELFKQAVTLLRELMPPRGLDDDECWKDRDAALLAGVIGRFPEGARDSVITLLRQGASSLFEPRLCLIAQIALDDEELWEIEDFAEYLICGNAAEYRIALRKAAQRGHTTRIDLLRKELNKVEMRTRVTDRPVGDIDGCAATKAIYRLLQRTSQGEKRTLEGESGDFCRELVRADAATFAEIVAPLSTTLLGTLFLAHHLAHAIREDEELTHEALKRRHRSRRPVGATEQQEPITWRHESPSPMYSDNSSAANLRSGRHSEVSSEKTKDGGAWDKADKAKTAAGLTYYGAGLFDLLIGLAE